MPKIDLSITISAIVALAAVISPIFTAIINNRYQLKLKKLDLAHQNYENNILYQRNIFECYLKFVGRCINYSDPNALKEYGEYYFLAITYAPADIRNLMIKINHEIMFSDFTKATELLEEVTPKIHTMLKTM